MTSRMCSVLVALLFVGCVPEHYGPQIRRWGEPEAHIVVPLDAPECAFWAVREAWSYLSPRVPLVVTRGIPGNPVRGQIAIDWSEPEGTAKGLTTQWLEGNTTIRATVQVHDCSVRLIAHELGHAMGLPNTDFDGDLMNGHFYDGGWELSKDERAALRSSGAD